MLYLKGIIRIFNKYFKNKKKIKYKSKKLEAKN